ncbi:MAG TPA: glycosyltransferase family 4 protein [Burkholderiales bacterium]|nr:glycosyltransferase family 4 protein [Burkholderiales bacterium]
MSDKQSVTLVGHPFLLTGQGEHIRAAFRSMRATGIDARVLDIYGTQTVDQDLLREIGDRRVERLDGGINVFCINGDEVDQAFRHLNRAPDRHGYDVVYPAWELPRYPTVWAGELDRFDEVWAFSRFMLRSVEGTIKAALHHMPVASEARIVSFMGRRYFGLPESGHHFLFLFDFTSYIERKNPYAGINAFAGLLRARARADVHFVIKVNGSRNGQDGGLDRLRETTAPYRDRITIIDKTLGENEMKNLIRCCDCFLSLHRSEGFGRGLAEAMFLGKPVIATAYSGNMDFMTPENSFLVDYELVPVGETAYPHGAGQVWAEPNIDQAVSYMVQLTDDPRIGQEVGRCASRAIRQHLSYRSIGLNYLARFEEIAATRGSSR